MDVQQLAATLAQTARDLGLSEISGTINFQGEFTTMAKITVQVRDPGPVLLDDVAETLAGQPVVIHPLANDTDPLGRELRISAVTQPASGSVVISADGKSVTFTPAPGFVGEVTFDYTAVPV